MKRRSVLVVGLSALAATSAAWASDTYTVHSGTTVLNLDQTLLARHGLEVRVLTDEERDGVAGSKLQLLPFSEVQSVIMDDGVAFTRGQVQHREELAFVTSRGAIFADALGFSLVGEPLASGIQLTPGTIAIDHSQGAVDIEIDSIRLTPEFAAWIGVPALGDAVIGSGAARLNLSHHGDLIADGMGDGSAGDRGGCTPSTGPDVIVGDMPGMANYTNVGNIDAFAVATTSCNIGSTNLQWVATSVNHPIIPQNMYRLKTVDGSTRFEQVGLGWMKHAFTALTQNLCCTCNGQGGSVLGVGCSDPYSATRNGTQVTTTGGLGPRFQVNAHSGAFIWPYMFRNNGTYIPHTNTTRRIQVHVDDLNPALNSGALYYVESQYVTPDDAANRNQDNNASYRRITIGGANPNYTAATTASTVREQPAIRAWKTNDASVVETFVNTPEAANSGGDTTALVILAADATDLGGGLFHYEFAIHNLNSDRSISSFSVPVGPGATVTNIGFHDVNYHSGDGFGSNTTTPVNYDGTDWPGSYDGANVSWALVPATPAGNSNALRWGSLYNFRFDANRAPQTGLATLGLFKPVAGQPDTITASTVIPTPETGVPCVGDLDGNGSVDLGDLATLLANFGGPGGAAQGDLDDNNQIDLSDLSLLLANFGVICP